MKKISKFIYTINYEELLKYHSNLYYNFCIVLNKYNNIINDYIIDELNCKDIVIENNNNKIYLSGFYELIKNEEELNIMSFNLDSKFFFHVLKNISENTKKEEKYKLNKFKKLEKILIDNNISFNLFYI